MESRKVLCHSLVHGIIEHMNEHPRHAGDGHVAVLDASAVRAFHDRLDAPIATDNPLEEARAVAELQHALSARLARLAVAAHETQQACDVARGVPAKDTVKVVGSHLGFARRCSGARGKHFVGVAHALVEDMPHTMEALAAGVICEEDAAQVVRETSNVSRADRRGVDAAICDRLGRVATRTLVSAARAAAYDRDPDGVRARRIKAESERRVSLRPAPDSMAYLTALLPVKDGDGRRARGTRHRPNPRRQRHRRAGQPAHALGLVDRGHPRIRARVRARPGGSGAGLVHPRRPDRPAGAPVVHSPRHRRHHRDGIPRPALPRRYPGLLARLILFRDQVCRTPWCGAPIRHTDHIHPHATGGPTAERNGQGLCARCNYVKEHPDYHVTGTAAETTTNAGGFTATSHPPAPPGLPPPTTSYVERSLMDITWHHSVSCNDLDDEDDRSNDQD